MVLRLRLSVLGSPSQDLRPWFSVSSSLSPVLRLRILVSLSSPFLDYSEVFHPWISFPGSSTLVLRLRFSVLGSPSLVLRLRFSVSGSPSKVLRLRFSVPGLRFLEYD